MVINDIIMIKGDGRMGRVGGIIEEQCRQERSRRLRASGHADAYGLVV